MWQRILLHWTAICMTLQESGHSVKNEKKEYSNECRSNVRNREEHSQHILFIFCVAWLTEGNLRSEMQHRGKKNYMFNVVSPIKYLNITVVRALVLYSRNAP